MKTISNSHFHPKETRYLEPRQVGSKHPKLTDTSKYCAMNSGRMLTSGNTEDDGVILHTISVSAEKAGKEKTYLELRQTIMVQHTAGCSVHIRVRVLGLSEEGQ